MRRLTKDELRRAFESARQYTRAVVDDLTDDQWRVPRLAIVNPTLWEIGHIGWFMEYWCLRWRGASNAPRDSMLEHADRRYDSARVTHDTRWDLDLPSRQATLRYLDSVLAATLDALEAADDDPAALYFFQLALYHEDMHGEALAYTRQTCGYAPPPRRRAAFDNAGEGVAKIDATQFEQGASRAVEGFVFDNEKWGHPVELKPYSIARRLVSAGDFAAFVDDGGYSRSELWDAPGQSWLATTGARHPVYWKPSSDGWEVREFDRWRPIDPSAPMTHVNLHEAAAWCRWAGRRLPTESEWEYAALTQQIEPGAAWEWTTTPFLPYPGFQPDPYSEYSAPWFETHFSVRGASPTTSERMLHPKYRNFYMADRSDIFVGFRPCEVD